MSYNIVDIIDEDDRIELLDILSTIKPVMYHQDYNLFHVEKAAVGKSHRLYECEPVLKHIDWIEKNTTGLRIASAYFVKYPPGGFARAHHDNGTSRTIVTLLESVNLVGGETIFVERYEKRPRVKQHVAKRNDHENDKPPYGRKIMPKVAHLKNGQSIVYGKDQMHSVAEVEQGHRTVLVSWYIKKEPE